MRALKSIFAVAIWATTAFAQQSSSDSQLTQALLTEVRQLRQDLQATAGVILRAQIVMYRLQVESGLLTRATQRLDDARTRCSSYQSQIRTLTVQIEQLEAQPPVYSLAGSNPPPGQNPNDQRNIQSMLARYKSTLAAMTNEDQQCQSRLVEAQSQVQVAQSRVDDFQSQLDKIDKLLAGITAK